MYYKNFCFAIIALLFICNDVYGKKVKKIKRPKDQEDTTTIQPNVVAYSTFGFNDVGGYDGFVPTSPEYSSFLSGVNNQESSTRLYAPAFPSAADATGFGGNIGSQSFDGQTFGLSEDGANQAGMSLYSSNSMHLYNSPNFAATGEQSKNSGSGLENINNQNAEESDAPIYGTKINSRHRNRPVYSTNNSEFGINSNGFSNPSDDKYPIFNNAEPQQSTQEKPTFSEASSHYQNTNNYAPNYAPQLSEDFGKAELTNVLNFPRVVDFTKLTSKYYPTELDTNKYISDSMKHSNQQMSMVSSQIDSSFVDTLNEHNKLIGNSPSSFEQTYSFNNNEETSGNNLFKPNKHFEPEYTNKHVSSHYKHETNTKKPDQKKRIKHKPWMSGNHSNAFKDWKDSSASSSSTVKGYGYSTNYSNMNFKYDVSEPKKPFNHDEIEPASSNIVDLTSYTFPAKAYSNFKKQPEFNNDDEYSGGAIYNDRYKSSDHINQFKNTFNTAPATSSSYWGNTFKSADYSSFGEHPKKPHYSVTEDIHDDVVNIPKRPHKFGFTKSSQNKQVDWPHYRPQKLHKPVQDWTKDFIDTRYKSEEDLLGLRTHDTSHPSYLPTYKPSNNVVDNDNDFKQLVEKWKQSYIKTKYKDVPVRDYEGYGSELKPYHVPIPKPYPIEVPHPVIVPVPHPFPVRVPISRPVVVPVLREVTVPIEKPVPYPVYKNVPYPIEKPVPVPVTKEVAVPVEKPYAVHIPYVRPVFHHTKPVHEDPEHIDDEDYPRRPEFKKPTQYKKRQAYGTRNRTRRPSRASYQERNRRRWPDRRRPSGYNPEYRHSSRPNGFQHSPPYRHHKFENEAEEDEHSEYAKYCRQIGNC